ncbi:MAG: formylglycine-generating enzyme family protein, partial [Treponema sp.]|nr:formylglycine-generating enzyme family protein [Treponema sp.]
MKRTGFFMVVCLVAVQVFAQNVATPNVPSDMVRINGGTFMMGSPASEAGRNDDEVQHRVTVSSFYLGKYEVTQREYVALMGTNPSYFKGDNLPVERVSWYDAVEYCNARSRKEGLTPAYTISGSEDDRTVTWNRNA